jgi:high-affinity K+ transport system ATPase subunit B
MKRRIAGWGWTGLGVHLMIYMMYLGLLTLKLNILQGRGFAFIAMAWLGLIILHVIFLGSVNESTGKQKTHALEEKPKRDGETYALTDDGELELVEEQEDTDYPVPDSEWKHARR